MSTISASPLTWPPQFPRRAARESGAFKTTLPKALSNVQQSLQMFARDSGKKIENLVISSNYTLGVTSPTDPGVAVWFVWDGMQVCIPVDRYSKVESNLQAIHHIIEARRTELRHGTLALVRATFTGFKSLPAPAADHWSEVLSVPKDAQPADIKAAYQRLRSTHHPDRGGNNREFQRVQEAFDSAQKEGRA